MCALFETHARLLDCSIARLLALHPLRVVPSCTDAVRYAMVDVTRHDGTFLPEVYFGFNNCFIAHFASVSYITPRPVNLKCLHRAPLFFKMAQNLDLRCVLAPAPWVLGGQNTSRIQNKEVYATLHV